jgi:hypothetical protein
VHTHTHTHMHIHVHVRPISYADWWAQLLQFERSVCEWIDCFVIVSLNYSVRILKHFHCSVFNTTLMTDVKPYNQRRQRKALAWRLSSHLNPMAISMLLSLFNSVTSVSCYRSVIHILKCIWHLRFSWWRCWAWSCTLWCHVVLLVVSNITLHYYHEDRGNIFIKYVGNHLWTNTASQCRRPQSMLI